MEADREQVNKQMRVMVLTQEESVYLPSAIAAVCRHLGGTVRSLVCAPAMSTHGGTLPGLIRHVRLFGLTGTCAYAGRALRAKALSLVTKPNPAGPCHSRSAVARAFGIPFHRVANVNSQDFIDLVGSYGPDLLVSMSCPQIIRERVRGLFPMGAINVHGAPLPRYRGLMPAFWVLRNGEESTAVTVHELGDALDDGAILVQRRVPILESDTWDSLVRRSKAAGAEAVLEAVAAIEDGTVERKANPREDSTYFAFPSPADRRAFLRAGRRFF